MGTPACARQPRRPWRAPKHPSHLTSGAVDKPAFIARYGQAVDERRATSLVGAGLSLGAGYPDWAGLLEPIRVEAGRPKIGDLALLAQYIETATSRERLIAAMCKGIGSVDPVPTENHRLLAQLPIDTVWTTNFDPLIEVSSGPHALVELDEQLIDADGSLRRVYKMHGSIPPAATEPVGGIHKLVITRNDFDRYERDHPRFWRLLQADFLTRSFLFLGFSLSDPNFEAAMKMVRLTTPDRPMTHYAVLRREGDDFDARVADLATGGVEIIEIAEHNEVSDLLRRLVARTRPSRLFISGSEPKRPSEGPDGDRHVGRYPAATELSDELRTIAQALGRRLARTGIRVATANLLGAEVGYTMLDELGDDGYDPERMLLIRRDKQEPADPPNKRRGQITFVGHNPTDMRTKIYAEVRAVVVIAGGGGTASEVAEAHAAGMGVVPIARSGGTAWTVWAKMIEDLGHLELGGQPIESAVFQRLADDDIEVATDAAVHLIRQAMYLSESPA